MLATAMSRTLCKPSTQLKSWSSLAIASRKTPEHTLPQSVVSASQKDVESQFMDASKHRRRMPLRGFRATRTQPPTPNGNEVWERYLEAGKYVGAESEQYFGELGNMPLFGRNIALPFDGLGISIGPDEHGIAESLQRKKIKKLLHVAKQHDTATKSCMM